MTPIGGGGETAKEPSGWTTDVLRAHVEAVFYERDQRYEQRFVAQEKAVASALNAARDAVMKAEAGSEKRFEGVNEFRATLSDQAGRLASRESVEELSRRISTLENMVAGIQGRTAAYTVAIGIVFTLVTIALRFIQP